MSRIHATAVVEASARLADDVEVGPYSLIGPDVTLGPGVLIGSHVVIEGVTELGEGCVVHPFAVLGSAPQHAGHQGEATQLVIGARNLIREQVTMHCGTATGRGVTTVGSDGFFMVGVHVGHDCIVGDHVVMANTATLGGHVVLEDCVIMGGLSAAHQFTRIGRHAFVGGMAGVNHDVIPFGNVWGNHAHLEGLNLVGLKRRGFSRESINALRAAYRMLFAEEGTFQERLDDTAYAYSGSPEVMEIVDFIRADSSRPLTTPQREV
ncbi:MAG TPA: acyl-ACP--UDP-N-acetylglucosamine O-acyltransferase [Caulobacteraceae bacterium]|jgi:UDP-N-acetylglucosamine acyltransferase|nr:acyl-ACP--UDP-N-acetylglucosamine O-acyltransferase [Caulobacteraceae bacterium]